MVWRAPLLAEQRNLREPRPGHVTIAIVGKDETRTAHRSGDHVAIGVVAWRGRQENRAASRRKPPQLARSMLLLAHCATARAVGFVTTLYAYVVSGSRGRVWR